MKPGTIGFGLRDRKAWCALRLIYMAGSGQSAQFYVLVILTGLGRSRPKHSASVSIYFRYAPKATALAALSSRADIRRSIRAGFSLPVNEATPYPFPSSAPFTAVNSRVHESTRSAMASRMRWAAAG